MEQVKTKSSFGIKKSKLTGLSSRRCSNSNLGSETSISRGIACFNESSRLSAFNRESTSSRELLLNGGKMSTMEMSEFSSGELSSFS